MLKKAEKKVITLIEQICFNPDFKLFSSFSLFEIVWQTVPKMHSSALEGARTIGNICDTWSKFFEMP